MNTIDNDTLEVLRNSTCAIDTIALPNVTLDRKQYLAVNKVLENLGGKWNRKQKVHIFSEDITEPWQEVLKTGQYEAKLDELNKVYNFFETPEGLAQRMVALANIQEHDIILEPSAGRGAIARVIRDEHEENELQCIEMNIDNAMALGSDSFNVDQVDFLETHDVYDVIIANPPFSKGRDAKHIIHMLGLAEVIVAVGSAAIMYRDASVYRDLRTLIGIRGGSLEKLPAGTFKESGTMVETCLVVVNARGF